MGNRRQASGSPLALIFFFLMPEACNYIVITM